MKNHPLKPVTFSLLVLLFTLPLIAKNEEKSLRIGIMQEWDTLNSVLWTTYPASLIASTSLRGFIQGQPDGSFKPVLVESIPKPVTAGKNVVLQMKIKQEAKWGDGTPLICDDLKIAWEIGKHPKTGVMSKEDYEVITEISWPANDPKDCKIVFKENRFLLVETSLPRPLPAHLERSIFEKSADKGQYATETTYIKNPTHPGLYNGPYMVSEMVRGSHVLLKPNPHWLGQKASIAKILFKYLPSTESLLTQMKTQEINYSGSLGLTMEQSIAFENTIKQQGLPYKIEYESMLDLERLMINLDNEFLKDLTLRQALAWSLDRKAVVELSSKGKFQVADNPIFATSKKQNFPALKSISKREAQRMLEKAGYKMGADGYFTKDGKPVEVLLSTTAGNRMRETNLTYIADQWKKIGIKAIIKNYPARVLIGQMLRCREFNGIAEVAFGTLPDFVRGDAYGSKNIPTDKKNCTGLNASGWRNKKVDEIIDQLDKELNPDKRQQLLEAFAVEYINDLPEIPLYKVAQPIIYPKDLKGNVKSGPYGMNFSFVETWSL